MPAKLITFVKVPIRSVLEGQRSISPNLSPKPLEPVANCPSNIKLGEMQRFAKTSATFLADLQICRFAGAWYWPDQGRTGRAEQNEKAGDA